MNSKVQGMIGLCIRAGKVSYGSDGVKKAIRTKKAKLVLLSDNASERCKKDINDICIYYNVETICDDFADMFYQLTSKALMKVMSINDEGFAREIKSLTF